MIYIVEAYCDEHGKAIGGNAGDQTGREIRRSVWRDFGSESPVSYRNICTFGPRACYGAIFQRRDRCPANGEGVDTVGANCHLIRIIARRNDGSDCIGPAGLVPRQHPVQRWT